MYRDKHDEFDLKYLKSRGRFIQNILDRITEHSNEHGFLLYSMLTYTYGRAAAQFGGIKEIVEELKMLGYIRMERFQGTNRQIIIVNTKKEETA